MTTILVALGVGFVTGGCAHWWAAIYRRVAMSLQELVPQVRQVLYETSPLSVAQLREELIAGFAGQDPVLRRRFEREIAANAIREVLRKMETAGAATSSMPKSSGVNLEAIGISEHQTRVWRLTEAGAPTSPLSTSKIMGASWNL